MEDSPKSPLKRRTGQVPPLLRGARGDRVNVPHECENCYIAETRFLTPGNSSETGFLASILVIMQKLWQKPGFSPPATIQKPGLFLNLWITKPCLS